MAGYCVYKIQEAFERVEGLLRPRTNNLLELQELEKPTQPLDLQRQV
jgi:hypothetical protein